jgi:hypothetical protein
MSQAARKNKSDNRVSNFFAFGSFKSERVHSSIFCGASAGR